MNKRTGFSSKKKIDYFGLMEKHESEMKLQLIEELKKETALIKKTPKNIVETPAMKARKAEINAAKAEIHLLKTTNQPEIKKDVMTINNERKRRSELINSKRVLEAAVGRRLY